MKKENKVQFKYEIIIYLKDANPKTIPDKSKFVNIGSSAFLSGGQDKRTNIYIYIYTFYISVHIKQKLKNVI